MLPMMLMLQAAQDTPVATPLNPPSWIGPDDYPAPALRAREQGVVGVKLAVNPDGSVSDCVVTTSSGHADLDGTTCELLRLRARFKPVVNPLGKPSAGYWNGRFRWQVPPVQPIAQASWHSIAVMTLSRDGKILSCKDHVAGAVPAGADKPCNLSKVPIPAGFLARIGDGKPVSKVALEIAFDFADSPLPPAPGWTAGLTLSARSRSHLQISEMGTVDGCYSDPVDKEGWLAPMPDRCLNTSEAFVPRVGADGKPQRGSAVKTIAYWKAP